MSLPEKSDPLWQDIGASIAAHTGQHFGIEHIRGIPGGCINDAARIDSGPACYFVKLNRTEMLPMFEAEADALETLAGSNTLRVPKPVCSGRSGNHAWLVLEYLDLRGSASKTGWACLGNGLAQLHRHEGTHYGWHRDNTIGATAQKNMPRSDWIEFLREQRIGFQLELAYQSGYRERLQRAGQELLDNLHCFFTGYAPAPSLLHGDLWSGNVGFLQDGEPVIIDPAPYFGDREADVAMTELFGGFAGGFYRAYEAQWRLDDGYKVRKHLYNVYHLLNHLNLFGPGYLSSCESTIDRLLSEIR